MVSEADFDVAAPSVGGRPRCDQRGRVGGWELVCLHRPIAALGHRVGWSRPTADGLQGGRASLGRAPRFRDDLGRLGSRTRSILTTPL